MYSARSNRGCKRGRLQWRTVGRSGSSREVRRRVGGRVVRFGDFSGPHDANAHHTRADSSTNKGRVNSGGSCWSSEGFLKLWQGRDGAAEKGGVTGGGLCDSQRLRIKAYLGGSQPHDLDNARKCCALRRCRLRRRFHSVAVQKLTRPRRR